ncbi:MAG: hypothetical protein ACYTE1_11045, partial [Planctomycetota bacterium]
KKHHGDLSGLGNTVFLKGLTDLCHLEILLKRVMPFLDSHRFIIRNPAINPKANLWTNATARL